MKNINNNFESNKEQPKEIEKKFLIESSPENLNTFPHKEIIQGYIAITEDGTEVRLRKKKDKYYQTVKSGSGKIRTENEVEITKEQFDVLWGATVGKRINKTRYEIPDKAGVIELDIYHEDLNGLKTAEIEFNSEEASLDFVPPVWFGKEVTENKAYKNQNLARNGIPQESIKAIPEYELNIGVEKLIQEVEQKVLENKNGTIIVEIAGGSASGKTSAVSKKLMEAFNDEAVLISMDDYYYGQTFMDHKKNEGNELNWDQPEALNIPELRKNLEDLKQGKTIQKPKYDFKTGEPIGSEEIMPRKVIVIEGLFALNDEIKTEGDVKVFVDIGTHGRIIRRLLRDVVTRGKKPEDIISYFSGVVEPMHEKYIQNTKQNADMVIKNEYKPEVEAERSGLHEIQLKFKADIDLENLRKLGVDKLGQTTQIDHYYNPKDRNLTDTDEILRIREEGSATILTYKGPRIKSQYRDRPKFEFNIDSETKTKFLSIYGNESKSIKKERILYQLDSIVFSVDKVSKLEGDIEKIIGTYVEVRSTDKSIDEKKLNETLSKLGLNIKDGIKETYFELAE